jgi:hypothetical protein
MVFQGDLVDPAEEEEMIYIRDQKKAEDDEMQMLTPIMLDSMFDLKSPPDLFRILKDTDKLDDATVMTTESFSDILLPSLNTPPRITSLESYEDNDDASEISTDSYYRGEVPSPRNVISATRNATNCPFGIPADVRYEGEVHFSVSSFSRTIHLQPRQSAQSESIFVPKSLHQEYPIYSDYALADSMSSFGESGGGAEECKDDETVSSADEGFAYVHAGGDRCKEEDYWGIYDGHYGSRDYMDDSRDNVDYALDHASVQGSFDEPAVQSLPSTSHYEAFNSQDKSTSIFDEIQDMFAMCFSCGGQASNQFSKSAFSSRTAPVREGGSFGPADYGVSPQTLPRAYETYDPNPTPIVLSNYADYAAVYQQRAY